MKRNSTFALIAINTSGKGIQNNRIIELSILRMEHGTIVERFGTLVNPEQPIPNYITARCGIDDLTVSDSPTFDEIAQKVESLISGAILVGHQVSFSHHVLGSEFGYSGRNFEPQKLCTERLSKKLLPQLFSYDLGKICSSLGIPFMDGYGTTDTADATMLLFQRLLSLDDNFKEIDAMLAPKPNVLLPPYPIHSEQIAKLPAKPGIYKFQDKDGIVIYIGKAKDIKKRVLSHFQSGLDKEVTLCKETFSIDFELTGSELIALLLEADLIQKQLPRYNTLQKKLHTAFHIKAYPNKIGILQMAVEELPALHETTELFFSKGAAKSKLEKLCEEFNLCPKFTGLQRKKGRCNHAKFPECLGVCCDREEIHLYNGRAEKAIASLLADTDSFIITEKGRWPGEKAFVLILDGTYQGFGFVDGSQQVSSVTGMIDLIQPRKQTYHATQIITAYRKKNPYRTKIMKTISD